MTNRNNLNLKVSIRSREFRADSFFQNKTQNQYRRGCRAIDCLSRPARSSCRIHRLWCRLLCPNWDADRVHNAQFFPTDLLSPDSNDWPDKLNSIKKIIQNNYSNFEKISCYQLSEGVGAHAPRFDRVAHELIGRIIFSFFFGINLYRNYFFSQLIYPTKLNLLWLICLDAIRSVSQI